MTTEQLIATQINPIYSHPGGFFRLLISPEQTGGSLAMIDLTLARGAEPPRHVHACEDETFYVIQGTLRLEVGDGVTIAEAGQAAFAPRNIEHQFFIQTDQVRMLVMLTPGDFVNFFLESGEILTEEPANVQAPQGPPPAEIMAHMIAWLNGRFGVQFV